MLSKKSVLLLPAIIIVIGLTACSTAALSSIKTNDAPGPSIEILVPRDDPAAVGITGDGWCAVLVEVANFKLVDKPGEANAAGEGHIHYYLDADPLNRTGYADSSETIHYWPQIGIGQHTFGVELVNNDHTPLNPPVIASARATAGMYWDS